MILTAENYYSREANEQYMSCSQFKSFLSCEASALAGLRSEYGSETTTAMLIGSYVDAYFEGTLESFKSEHPECFKRDGSLKSEYIHADYMIQRAERDKLFMRYMSGEKQRIMTGEISGVPFKIKIDSYLDGICITDLKCIKDLKPVWDEDARQRKHFINYWGYDIQGAIYREIVRQNTGKLLPFYIAAITKEKPEPRLKVYWLPDEDLDHALSEVQSLAPRFQQIKEGKLQPQRCGECSYCRYTEILTEPINYHEEMEEYEPDEQ